MGKQILQWIMKSKLRSICNETRVEINPGDMILYIPRGRDSGAQVFCNKSKAYARATSRDEVLITGFKDN